MKRMPIVAIAGRSNTGKSTLFNRLIGRKQAIVAACPGVTRDRNEAIADIFGTPICLVDTGGVEEKNTSRFTGRLWDALTDFLPKVDLILFCIDGREGVTEEDKYFAKWLRRQNIPYLLVVNKIEGQSAKLQAYSAYELGMGDPHFISAEHGEGVGDLCEQLLKILKDGGKIGQEPPQSAAPSDEEKHAIRVVIAGRPNTGKSTLLNTIIGESRLLTGDEAGVTRDCITIDCRYGDQDYAFVDTAGLRKKATINDFVEKKSASASLGAIKMAEIVVLVIDAVAGVHAQDLQIARHVEEEGRGCLIVLNKWDKVEDPRKTKELLLERLFTSFSQMRGMPVLLMSAIKKKSVMHIFPQLREVYEAWNKRVSTGELNRWFADATSMVRPPLAKGHQIKLRYITQIKTRPPTFALFGTRLENLPRSYQRYLVTSLKENFALGATPVRLYLRTRANPYDKK